jgi:hypothetical protein
MPLVVLDQWDKGIMEAFVMNGMVDLAFVSFGISNCMQNWRQKGDWI